MYQQLCDQTAMSLNCYVVKSFAINSHREAIDSYWIGKPLQMLQTFHRDDV